MAIRDIFATRKVETVTSERVTDVAAQLGPVTSLDSLTPFFGGANTATREEAMSVPTVARARNIICSSIASIGLEVIDRSTGMELDEATPRVIRTPDPRIPGSATYVWTCEDLLFYGYAYWQITELFADTYRVRSVQRVSPARVTIQTNSIATEIEYYMVDGTPVPNSGVGSLVVFNGNDEGLLNRAGKTIRTGAELERAAAMYAREPIPSMVLKSNGTALPADRIAKLLDSWGSARRNRSTAFLNADVTLETVGFDPEKLQLNQARSYVSTELARATGIPAYYVDAETGSSMTYSNATNQRQSLLDFSLIPLMTSISERLSMPDFVPQSQEVKYDLSDYLRGSDLERANIYKTLNSIVDPVTGNPAITVDEIRQAEEMIK
ncbi:portal_HK97, phage portal protein, HK97 family [uncultured Caudovirales phage]|uniref:Portal_HK97, phage portal protein, HK97 family n=1 Tax=uncultured Caudovirales phage TaxID=2100421 RepID=A0A6J5R350_9CAUD|nr:portal_HK97, phage portal protein, HK97 family [uncultured Caudovirales phage]CAB4191163.1 portal_HK97, phage portal protein, HK97 family [uncultured Caudovirales phage]